MIDLYGKIALFAQKDKYLVGVDNKNRVQLWNQSSFPIYQRIIEMRDEIKSIAFLENDLLAIGKCNNNKIEIWNVTNQSIILTLNDHNDCVNALLSVRLLNQSFLISGSDDKTIQLHDNNFKTLQILNIQDSVLTLNYNTNSMILIAGRMKDNSIKIWTFAHKILIEKVSAHNDTIRTICVLENGLIATGSDDSKYGK